MISPLSCDTAPFCRVTAANDSAGRRVVPKHAPAKPAWKSARGEVVGRSSLGVAPLRPRWAGIGDSGFSRPAGADLLKLTREDVIQICGPADGIRLFNALKGRYVAG